MSYQIVYPVGIEDEYDYWEIEQKGWVDIVIAVGERRFQVSIYDRERLSIEVRKGVERCGYFAAKNLVVVAMVNRAEIESAVASLAAGNFVELTD